MQIKSIKFHGHLVAYADDLTLVYSGREDTIETQMNEDLDKLLLFTYVYGLVINEKKTHFTVFNFMKKVSAAYCEVWEEPDRRRSGYQVTGIDFSGNMKFDVHLKNTCASLSRKVAMLSRLRHHLPTAVLNKLYRVSREPIFRYCSAIWSHTYDKPLEPLIKIQKKAARFILFEH